MILVLNVCVTPYIYKIVIDTYILIILFKIINLLTLIYYKLAYTFNYQ